MRSGTSGSFSGSIGERRGELVGKYDALWAWIRENGADSFRLTFAEIELIAGVPIDHSFLKYKKELAEYGYQAGKISMKEQTVEFRKLG